MISVQRILPYTKQLVLYALYDVLDSEESEYDKAENGGIAAKVTVYGNRSGFTLSVSEQPPATVLTVEISDPCEGLSRQGEQPPHSPDVLLFHGDSSFHRCKKPSTQAAYSRQKAASSSSVSRPLSVRE